MSFRNGKLSEKIGMSLASIRHFSSPYKDYLGICYLKFEAQLIEIVQEDSPLHVMDE